MDSFLNSSNLLLVDPRLADYPLVESIYKMPLIIFAYMYFVLVCGPRFMKNRLPYSLKTFIQIYNVVQFVANLWLVYSFWEAGYILKNLFCPITLDYSRSPLAMKGINIAMGFFWLKLLDYVETVIFVLRKKNNQVSGLHVYHHVSTSLIAWCSLRYYCVGPTVFICIINSAVHVIMYLYYFLAACGPDIQKNITPLKRCITIVQMVQFLFLMLYLSQNFITYCKVVSHWSIILFLQNLLLNLYLFYNFYQKTYVKPQKMQ
ncbi:elongation of very long chain fatty acids protein 1-like isoform X1 [Odontomachus brunneus]|uniref:elongation of very long chain fatty acids protein 1-like isoform X1 n=2 Tax=Odontomachus brunneus TaxID=486640 RepID=UPI0013F1864C|nr:elongation of very long chain fatty acids protein 1-like isoform X1 [Odontomachus brunneus]